MTTAPTTTVCERGVHRCDAPLRHQPWVWVWCAKCRETDYVPAYWVTPGVEGGCRQRVAGPAKSVHECRGRLVPYKDQDALKATIMLAGFGSEAVQALQVEHWECRFDALAYALEVGKRG